MPYLTRLIVVLAIVLGGSVVMTDTSTARALTERDYVDAGGTYIVYGDMLPFSVMTDPRSQELNLDFCGQDYQLTGVKGHIVSTDSFIKGEGGADTDVLIKSTARYLGMTGLMGDVLVNIESMTLSVYQSTQPNPTTVVTETSLSDGVWSIQEHRRAETGPDGGPGRLSMSCDY